MKHENFQWNCGIPLKILTSGKNHSRNYRNFVEKIGGRRRVVENLRPHLFFLTYAVFHKKLICMLVKYACLILFSQTFWFPQNSLCSTKMHLILSCQRYLSHRNKPSGLKLFKKGTPAQLFSSKYCKYFKSTYFEQHLWTAAFALLQAPSV